MGQGKSRERYEKAVGKLSTLELDNIEGVFSEISTRREDGSRHVEISLVNRRDFAERFRLPGFVAERLFHAFDRTETGTIDLEEFIGGIALCLHGSVRDKCRLLFKIFDLDEDDGVSKDELTAVLLSSVESAEKILNNIEENAMEEESDSTDKLIETVTKIVDEAFHTCDVSKSGKLSAKEFENWLYRTPQIMDNVFGWQCPRPEEGHWMNEVLPNSPTIKIGILESHSPTHTSPFKLQFEGESVPLGQKEPRSLSDLFSSPQTTVAEPQSFFDTISETNDTFVDTQIQSLDSQVKLNLQQEQITQDIFQSAVISGDSFLDQSLTRDESVQSDFSQDSIPSQNASAIQEFAPSQGPFLNQQNTQDQFQALQISQDPIQADHNADNPILVATEGQRHDETHHPTQDDSTTPYTLQYVQQQFASPQITQLHMQSAQSPQETFLTPTIQTTPKGIQTVQVTHDPLQGLHTIKPALDPMAGLDLEKERHQIPVPTMPDAEVHSTQTEEDRMYSAWIPSPQTRQLLATIGSGMMSNADVDQQFLTSPGIVVDEPQIDPVKDMLLRFIGEQEAEKRQILTVDSVPLNESGLRELLAANCWRAGLDFTARFLTAHGQGVGQQGQRALHTHKTLQIWFCRISLLFKLQMYSTAEAELDAFNNFDQPDLYYEYYPETYPGRKGCMVPFSMRILHAELPQHIGKPNEALDRLYGLQRMGTRVIGNLSAGLDEDGTESEKTDEQRQAAITLWKERDLRVVYAIGNCFFAVKDYNLAVSVFEGIRERDPTKTTSLNSGIGRIYLQLGDLERAESYFKQVEDNSTGDPEELSTVVMNKGFVSLATGSYEDAHKHFVAVTKLDPENSVAINNVAVCLLFLGNLKEALHVLESAIWSNPPRNLNDGLLFNLCTIYELESSWSMQKKHKLLELVAQYKGDGFNASCLKIA